MLFKYECWNMMDTIGEIVNDINNNGGWIVIGRYKRGLINDQTMVSEEVTNVCNNNNQNEYQMQMG